MVRARGPVGVSSMTVVTLQLHFSEGRWRQAHFGSSTVELAKLGLEGGGGLLQERDSQALSVRQR